MDQFRFRRDCRRGHKAWRCVLLLTLIIAVRATDGRDLFVQARGGGGGDGSFEAPFASIARGVQEAEPGDTIFIRGGFYYCRETIRIDKSGAPGKLIALRAYPGEAVVLDFWSANAADRGISLSGDYWHIEGLCIQHAGDNGVIVRGSHNVLERLVTRKNGDSGLQLHTGAAHNLVINCDSYLNYDPENHGENADGFAAKFGLGEGNVFIGCRAWSNSDDGFDFWQAGNGVVLEDCWAFRNGINLWDDPAFAGDGNGFKLGHGAGGHVLFRCVAYDHPHHGIDVNGNTTGVLVYNCSSVLNRGKDFYFDENSDLHVLRNNLSYPRSVTIYPEIDDQYNSWNGFRLGDHDFVSLDPNGIDGPRRADGGLPALSFLRLVSISYLVDGGVDVGWPFRGGAPDLGAFEHLPGDCVPDGRINAADLQHLAAKWLSAPGRSYCAADLDRSGLVDLRDFAIMAGNWPAH